MTVKTYRYTDTGAPNTNNSVNIWPSIPNLIKTLIAGYSGAPGPVGWTIKFDSIAANSGRLVLEDPEGTFYVFERGSNEYHLTFGMALDCDDAGNLVHYQSGAYNSVDMAGSKQTIYNRANSTTDEWVAFYDDVSLTFFLTTNTAGYTLYNYKNNDMDEGCTTIYMGPLKKNDGAAGVKIIAGTGDEGSYTRVHMFATEKVRATSLYGFDGTLMFSGDCLLMYSRIDTTDMYDEGLSQYPIPSQIDLQPITIIESRGGQPMGGNAMGALRGLYRAFSGLGSGRYDYICQWLDPDTYNSSQTALERPMTINGQDYFKVPTYYGPSYILTSDIQEWW